MKNLSIEGKSLAKGRLKMLAKLQDILPLSQTLDINVWFPSLFTSDGASSLTHPLIPA